jgi:hypothetical protein
MIALYCPNCIELNLLYDTFTDDFNLAFISRLRNLISIQINKQLSTRQVHAILNYNHRYLNQIKFLYNHNLFIISIDRPTKLVGLNFDGNNLLINQLEFKRQLRFIDQWSSFIVMNSPTAR